MSSCWSWQVWSSPAVPNASHKQDIPWKRHPNNVLGKLWAMILNAGLNLLKRVYLNWLNYFRLQIKGALNSTLASNRIKPFKFDRHFRGIVCETHWRIEWQQDFLFGQNIFIAHKIHLKMFCKKFTERLLKLITETIQNNTTVVWVSVVVSKCYLN